MKTAVPLVIVLRRLFSPMIVRQVTLLPEPDSPTMPSVFPFSTENETPSTALTMPSSVRKYVLRSLTSSRAIAEAYASLIRGSIQAYKRSTNRLKTMIATVAKTITPCIVGVS